jgi:hypothetical protein
LRRERKQNRRTEAREIVERSWDEGEGVDGCEVVVARYERAGDDWRE